MDAEAPIVITGVPMPFFDVARDFLQSSSAEGRVPWAYQDSLGFWTIGVGRLIDHRKGGGLRDDEIDYLLANDIKAAVMGMQGWPAWEAVKNDNVRATAMISMAFQIGDDGWSHFTTALSLIAAGQWQAAADDLATTLWAKQTPNRAKTICQMISTGAMPNA